MVLMYVVHGFEESPIKKLDNKAVANSGFVLLEMKSTKGADASVDFS